MANWSAKNIRRHLNLPVAVVTDRAPPPHYKFEQVIITSTEGSNRRTFADINESVTWRNGNRVDAYCLSPWSHTLVLDADYVVASDQLNAVLAVDQDFVAHRCAWDVTNHPAFDEHNSFGRNRMPMWWATVMMFRKSTQAQLIFEAMTMIRDNWTHYRRLYSNNQPTYRNDHALSIALNIENGHTLQTQDIPWSLASLTPDHQLTQLSADHYKVEYINSQNQPRCIELKHQDFHAMGKQQLGDIVANNS
jgi:hypothetical protein